jgi:hypothetical protein
MENNPHFPPPRKLCDQLNNLSAKRFTVDDRYYCESEFLGDLINNLSSKGDRYYCESSVLGDRF